MGINLYSEVKAWKKPLHLSKTFLAKSYLKALSGLEVIGITGSVGKTLTQNAIVSVLSQKYKTTQPDENLDPTFRIPQTILSAKPWHQKLILEYGVERSGEMEKYLDIAKPRIAVVTQISPTHLKYFKNTEAIFAEKSKLVSALGKDGHAVLNIDDPEVLKMAQLTKAKVWLYGQKSPSGVKISHFTQTIKGSKFRLHWHGQKASVSWKVVGRHQLTAAFAAATVGIISGLTLKQIAKGLSQAKSPAHRLNPISTKKVEILDDTYNSSPLAAKEAINTLVDIGKGKKKIAVFGEMKDLGAKSKEEHIKLGSYIGKTSINFLLTVGPVAKLIDQGTKANFKGKIINCKNSSEATKFLKKMADPKTLILIKGSRHAHLERIVYALCGKPTEINCYHCGMLK